MTLSSWVCAFSQKCKTFHTSSLLIICPTNAFAFVDCCLHMLLVWITGQWTQKFKVQVGHCVVCCEAGCWFVKVAYHLFWCYSRPTRPLAASPPRHIYIFLSCNSIYQTTYSALYLLVPAYPYFIFPLKPTRWMSRLKYRLPIYTCTSISQNTSPENEQALTAFWCVWHCCITLVYHTAVPPRCTTPARRGETIIQIVSWHTAYSIVATTNRWPSGYFS